MAEKNSLREMVEQARIASRVIKDFRDYDDPKVKEIIDEVISIRKDMRKEIRHLRKLRKNDKT